MKNNIVIYILIFLEKRNSLKKTGYEYMYVQLVISSCG